MIFVILRLGSIYSVPIKETVKMQSVYLCYIYVVIYISIEQKIWNIFWQFGIFELLFTAFLFDTHFMKSITKNSALGQIQLLLFLILLKV